MKLKLSILAVALALTGCGTFSNKGIQPNVDAVTPVKDVKVITEFKDEGIRITYTMSGKLEKIEVAGIAPSWKRNHEIIAEADAMDKLVKFVHGKSVTTDRRVKIISRALDNASDLTSNKFKSTDGSIVTDSKELEAEAEMKPSSNGEETQKDNTAKRNARIIDETTVNAIQTITSSGRLVGVIKTNDGTKDDGKLYVAYYMWSKQTMATSREVRNAMMAD